MIAAVVVAAGKGVRMGGPLPKQFLPLRGMPLVCHSLSAMARHVDAIVLVAAQQDIAYCRNEVLTRVDLPVPIDVVAGGQERQDSVYRGLCAVASQADLVLIHDAVRPFVPEHALTNAIRQAQETGACILGIPAIDTLKQVRDGRIEGTLQREVVWQAQTPQVFRTDRIVEAHRQAIRDGIIGTDDAALLERMGHPVAIVYGSRFNLKITTPEDFWIAEALFDLAHER
ncbi:MAG: 2-C-methyl-D-erythritol 4-phosphate cytidylyltransferase [Thermodesulfobacteriota bacterium]